MPYIDRFNSTNDIIVHLNNIANNNLPQQIQSRYAGFLSVSAVTVYEQAIKDIFIDFAYGKHKLLGSVIEQKFEKINGRIKIPNIKMEFIKPFGQKYIDKFNKALNQESITVLKTDRLDLMTCYSNLLTARHSFVHEGQINLTFQEVVKNYEVGKNVIHALNSSMKR